MRIVGTCVAFLLALAVTAPLAFFAALILAGPHGGVLPSSAQAAAFVVGWLFVLGVPILAARWAWRRLARPRDQRHAAAARAFDEPKR